MPNIGSPRSINERDDYLPAHAKAPCILYEGSYLSTPSEAQVLNTIEYSNEAGKRLAQSVDLFFGNNRPTIGVNVSPKEVNMVTGDTAKLSTVNVPNINTNESFTFISNDPEVCTVDNTGLISGIEEGSTTIKVIPDNNPTVNEEIKLNVYPASDINIEYEVFTDFGWEKGTNGKLAGGTDSGYPVYGIRAHLVDADGNTIDPNLLNLGYRTHIANKGWTPYTATNQVSGAEEAGNQIEAVEFTLNGENAQNYQIYYRSYVGQNEWTAFVPSNSDCGSKDMEFLYLV